MRRLMMAAAFAAAASSFALPAFAQSNPPDRDYDNPIYNTFDGGGDLGIDISSVPLTPKSVHKFLSGLSPQEQGNVRATCASDEANSAGVDARTMAFCTDATRT